MFVSIAKTSKKHTRRFVIIITKFKIRGSRSIDHFKQFWHLVGDAHHAIASYKIKEVKHYMAKTVAEYEILVPFISNI